MDDFSPHKKQIFWSESEARIQIQKYCAYQERAHNEVRFKLLSHGIYGDLLEEIISELIQADFLNEERFAQSYARGKFRIKHWGKNKIIAELKRLGVSKYNIDAGIKEINNEEYLETLHTHLLKKTLNTSFANQWDKKKKLVDFALLKGFEYDIIVECLSTMDTKL